MKGLQLISRLCPFMVIRCSLSETAPSSTKVNKKLQTFLKWNWCPLSQENKAAEAVWKPC